MTTLAIEVRTILEPSFLLLMATILVGTLVLAFKTPDDS